MKRSTWTLFNVLLGVSLLLPWIACIVGFAAPLARGVPRPSRLRTDSAFHWDRMSASGKGKEINIPWDDATQTRADQQIQDAINMQAMRESASKCATGGRALVALLAVSFVLLTVALAMFIARIAGFLSAAGSLAAELGLAALSFALMALAIIIWGTMCFGSLDEWTDNTRATSYIFIVLSTIFLLGALPLLGYMLSQAKKNAAPGPGSPAASEPWRRSTYGHGAAGGYRGRETEMRASQGYTGATPGTGYTASTGGAKLGERTWPERTGVTL